MKNLTAILALLLTFNFAFAQTTLRRNVGADLPAGMVIPFAGLSCPLGFLKANGASILKSKYPQLSSTISTFHGNGTVNPAGSVADTGCPHASNCMNLPDYRGLFLRMIDETKGNDIDKASRTAMIAGGAVGNAVGSVQSDGVISHTHQVRQLVNYILSAGATAGIRAFGDTFGDANRQTGYNTSLLANEGGNETRPKNAYVIYCVKY